MSGRARLRSVSHRVKCCFFGQPLVCLVCLECKKNDIVAAAFLCISVQKATSADFPERTGTSSPPHRAVGVHTLRLDSAVF